MSTPIRTAVPLVIVTAAAAVLASCGSVAAPGSAPRPAGVSTSVPASRSTPPAGGRGQAAALAGRMLAAVRLPSGARRWHGRIAPGLRTNGGLLAAGAGDTLGRSRFFVLPQAPAELSRRWRIAVPRGMAFGGSGTGGSPAGVTSEETSYTPRSLPAGIAQAQLVLTAVPARGGGSQVRADAQVTWHPARTAAEYVDPARYHALMIVVHRLNVRPAAVRKVVTSPALIARLAGLLDRSPADPGGAMSCPAETASYRLGLAVRPGGSAAIVITSPGAPCGGVAISAGGRPQPALDDRGQVVAFADRMLVISSGAASSGG